MDGSKETINMLSELQSYIDTPYNIKKFIL